MKTNKDLGFVLGNVDFEEMDEKDKKALERLEKEMEDAIIDMDSKRQDKILNKMIDIKKKYM